MSLLSMSWHPGGGVPLMGDWGLVAGGCSTRRGPVSGGSTGRVGLDLTFFTFSILFPLHSFFPLCSLPTLRHCVRYRRYIQPLQYSRAGHFSHLGWALPVVVRLPTVRPAVGVGYFWHHIHGTILILLVLYIKIIR